MNYKRANNILLALIIAINLYLIAAPLLPSALFWWQNRGGTRQTELRQKVATSSSTKVNEPNQLIIPSMLLDKTIVEGPVSNQIMNLRKGVWRWPASSTPDKGSNTVFLGHRFTYYNPRGVFYYLDKVKVGQTIGVIWNKQRYQYRVSDIKEVQPTATEILKPTKDSRLTIFTCTPLWLPKHRLVVIAQLISPTGDLR
jgi:LPXTG-site transpeptidase (sortase) family protein